MIDIREHLDLLGCNVTDKVTGFSGVVTSISFDLYGCIQILVHPGMDKDSKLGDQLWFDISRIARKPAERVMAPPNYNWTPSLLASGGKGPADKPRPNTA